MADALAKLLARIAEVLASGKFDGKEREWCRQAGVSESYIGALRSKHETGEAKTAKIEQVTKLARAAGVSVDWLMGSDVSRGPRRIPPIASEAAVIHDHYSAQLETVLETFPWPETLEPEEAAEVIALARGDAFRTQADIPQSYWHARVRRLIAEVQGRAKNTPPREAAEDVDLTQESPEIRKRRRSPRGG